MQWAAHTLGAALFSLTSRQCCQCRLKQAKSRWFSNPFALKMLLETSEKSLVFESFRFKKKYFLLYIFYEHSILYVVLTVRKFFFSRLNLMMFFRLFFDCFKRIIRGSSSRRLATLHLSLWVFLRWCSCQKQGDSSCRLALFYNEGVKNKLVRIT